MSSSLEGWKYSLNKSFCLETIYLSRFLPKLYEDFILARNLSLSFSLSDKIQKFILRWEAGDDSVEESWWTVLVREVWLLGTALDSALE